METSETLRILQLLADGIDPATGEVYPAAGPYQRADVVRALHAAIRALETGVRDKPPTDRPGRMTADVCERGPNTLDAARSRYPAPEFHPLLITEVTRMLQDHYCIAAYDLHGRKMARPLRPKGENWLFDEFQPAYRPGQVVNVSGWSARPEGTPPHNLDDMILKRGMDELEVWSGEELFSAMLPSAYETIAQLLDRRPLENRYVIEGTECRSLGGVRTTRKRVQFRAASNSRLRLHFEDADGELYILPVTCDGLRTRFDPDGSGLGVRGANDWLDTMPPGEPLVLRIGLTRGYAGNDGEFNPRRCYVQINGILSAHPLPTI